MENEIIVPTMPYMREIFSIFRTGKFISENTLSESCRRYYAAILNNFEAYYKYFDQLGYYLEQGPGYFHLCEARQPQAIQSKLRTDLGNYIQMLAILIKFRPELTPGHQFKTYEFQAFCDQTDEIKSILPPSDDGLMTSRVSLFLKGAAKEGFIDISKDETTCMITSAFLYLKEYVTRIKLYGEHAKFNLDSDASSTEGNTDNTEPEEEVQNGIIDMEE